MVQNNGYTCNTVVIKVARALVQVVVQKVAHNTARDIVILAVKATARVDVIWHVPVVVVLVKELAKAFAE